MKVIKRSFTNHWMVYADWAWIRDGNANWPQIHYTIKPEVDAWLKQRQPVGWFKRPAACWPKSAVRVFKLVATNGRIIGENPPAIKFRRESDMLLFKLTLAGNV